MSVYWEKGQTIEMRVTGPGGGGNWSTLLEDPINKVGNHVVEAKLG